MATMTYDEAAAVSADNVANRIDQTAAYIGVFKRADLMATSKGTEGVNFEFESPGGGSASFTCYTMKPEEDGTEKILFGHNQIQAMMGILGVRNLSSAPCQVMEWVDGKRIEIAGEGYKDLLGKRIGLVLQKEKYNKQDGSETFRMNLFAIFHPDTRLTNTEIKEGKVKAEKLEKILRTLKDKDSRVAKPAETAQPAMGLAVGDY